MFGIDTNHSGDDKPMIIIKTVKSSIVFAMGGLVHVYIK